LPVSFSCPERALLILLPLVLVFASLVFSPRACPSDFVAAGPRLDSAFKGVDLRLSFVFTPVRFLSPRFMVVLQSWLRSVGSHMKH
jgi:hypothetical protein